MSRGRRHVSFPPHHLWPPAEPWQGCCLQRSGPGKYSNQHLTAALMRWWALRWATPKSDCWAAGAGWETANSAGSGTNSQLMRTRNKCNLDKSQSHTLPPHSHIHYAHSQTSRLDGNSRSMSNFIYHLVNQPDKLQTRNTLFDLCFSCFPVRGRQNGPGVCSSGLYGICSLSFRFFIFMFTSVDI